MSAKLDKFFQNKLTGHTMTPSPGAWARVEAGLTKKNDGLVWFRWAAALMIPLLLAGVLVLRRSGDDAEKITALHAEKDKKNEPKKNAQENSVPASPKKRNEQTPALKSNAAKQNTQRPATPPKSKQLINVPLENMTARNEKQKAEDGENGSREVSPEQPLSPLQSVAETNKLKQPETIAATTATAVAAAPKEKSIILEYTLQSIEPETPVEKGITLTMELKEKSRFQKVFEFARDAKNSEGPLTVLRQAKQELFALNLKKDKHPK